MQHLFFLLFIVLICSCCTKENPNASGTDSITGLDYSVEKPYLKQVELTQAGRHCRMENPMIEGDRIIYFIKDDETGEGWINCYDKYSLELLWTWNDAHTEYGAKGFGNYSYIYNEVLCISQSNLSYGIDINTGLTLWHQKAESGRSYIFGLEDNIVKQTNEVFNADATLRKASYQDGEWKQLFSILQDDSLSVQMYLPCLFKLEGNNYAAVVTSKWLPSPVIRQYWLNLYSLTEDRLVWTSDTIPLHSNLSGIPGGLPVFTDGQILLGNNSIYSYNVEDGSLEWWKHYGNTFVGISSQLHARDGVLYANNEDFYLAAWDVHTGDEIFNVESGGLCSQLQYCDGKIYQTSVSTNNLMVFDAVSGERLFDVEAPYYKRFTEYDELRFQSTLTVDPETCLAYTTDKMHLLVYEFD